MSKYRDAIINLHRQGKSYTEIVAELGCSKSTVSYCLNPQTVLKKNARTREYRARKLARLNEIKESKPCVDCNKYFEGYLMDFDHLPQHVKVADVAHILRVAGWAKLEAELLKCEVVCCMCHRKRTKQRWLDNPLLTG